MWDTNLVIPKNDLEIIIAKFYRLKDVEIDSVLYHSHEEGNGDLRALVVYANYPKKRRKK